MYQFFILSREFILRHSLLKPYNTCPTEVVVTMCRGDCSGACALHPLRSSPQLLARTQEADRIEKKFYPQRRGAPLTPDRMLEVWGVRGGGVVPRVVSENQPRPR